MSSVCFFFGRPPEEDMRSYHPRLLQVPSFVLQTSYQAEFQIPHFLMIRDRQETSREPKYRW